MNLYMKKNSPSLREQRNCWLATGGEWTAVVGLSGDFWLPVRFPFRFIELNASFLFPRTIWTSISLSFLFFFLFDLKSINDVTYWDGLPKCCDTVECHLLFLMYLPYKSCNDMNARYFFTLGLLLYMTNLFSLLNNSSFLLSEKIKCIDYNV